MAKKSFASKPEQDGGVLANAPQHREIFKFVERLSEDVNALIFEFRKIIHTGTH
jgi:hypothetical protein